MCIGIGIQFFIEKAPIYKAFSILFNETGSSVVVKSPARGLISFFRFVPFN
jgi:hypothetical protein